LAEKDNRDEVTWVVYELTSAGERMASEGQLEFYIQDALDLDLSHPVFVPYLSYRYGTRASVFNVMEGYCFVASGLDDRAYHSAVHNSPYLKSVLSSEMRGARVLMTVPNANVQELRDQLAQMIAVEIEEGMEVEIVRGQYQGLEGRVVALTDEMAHVLIEKRTLRTIRTIPRFALLPRGDDV
jgi:transcription antitermination factor NusG